MSLAVFVESGMSFAGVGVRPPQPSLGSVLASAAQNWDANPAYAIGPLVAITLLCLGLLLTARGIGGRDG
jgi:peptide/nickel transport system permease protein